MTDAEAQDLQDLSREVAALEQSPWEPRCVARAFATPRKDAPVFTMQGWIDMEALHSPILMGRPPETLTELEDAANIFCLSVEGMTAEEAVDIAQQMIRTVEEAFAMALPMRPDSQLSTLNSQLPDGFGTWLPIWSCLVTQCGLHPDVALAMHVGRAYALIAAHRRNQGWINTGTPYALRDLSDSQPSTLNSQPSAE